MAQSDIFMIMSQSGFNIQADGNGDHGSTDHRCPGAIEVLSFSHKIQQKGTEEGGKPRSVEFVEHGEFEVVKSVDSVTPKIYKYCCTGEFIDEVKVVVFSAMGANWATAAPVPYLIYTMQYVHIATYNPSGGKGVPTEKLGLKYGQMNVKFDYAGIAAPTKSNGTARSGSYSEQWSHVAEMQGLMPKLSSADSPLTTPVS